MKPLYTITRDVQVGIFNSKYVARIYNDKIIVEAPYIDWRDGSGSLAKAKHAIRDVSLINEVVKNLEDGAEYDAFELIIGMTYRD